MTNLHDARVEAAIESAWNKSYEFRGVGGQTISAPPWEFQQVIRTAIAAADALLTEEMIAETAHKAMQESWTDSEEYEHAPAYIARAVLALIRGGEKR